jgi:thiamine pyrophosphate-dependent acetolactate synthase large subunit-like protein
MTQKQFLMSLCQKNKDAVIIGSLGTISYDLTDIPHENKILVRGAMGSVVGIGLGYAIAEPKKEVIVVVGDGSFVMKMGVMATVKALNPRNLTIFVIDNKEFKSVGGQKTNFYLISPFIDMFFCDVFEPKDELAP